MATIKLQYFKPSGKWGYDGQFECDNSVSPYAISDLVRSMATNKTLPGLASGSWEGFVHVDLNDHPMAFPMLVIL